MKASSGLRLKRSYVTFRSPKCSFKETSINTFNPNAISDEAFVLGSASENLVPKNNGAKSGKIQETSSEKQVRHTPPLYTIVCSSDCSCNCSFFEDNQRNGVSVQGS